MASTSSFNVGDNTHRSFLPVKNDRTFTRSDPLTGPRSASLPNDDSTAVGIATAAVETTSGKETVRTTMPRTE